MGRYSLNLRDKYGRGETTGGERIQAGIGDALQFWMQEDAARRAERNDVAAQGGVAVGAPPTAMDRIRGIGGALRRTMRRTPGITETGALTDTSNARDGVEPSLPSPSFIPSAAGARITPSFAFGDHTMPGMTVRRPFDEVPRAPGPVMTERLEDLRGERDPAEMRRELDDLIHRNGGYSDDSQDSGHGYAPPPRSMSAIATQPPPAANGAPQPSSNIAGAIQKTIYEGRNGQRYEIDPMRQQNIALAGKRAEAGVEDEIAQGRERRTQATKTAEQDRAIKALTDAGMPAAEARARVLTNTVRYDETFGAQRNAPMTQAERLEIQDRIDKRTQEAARLRAAGLENSDQYRQAMLAIATANLALATANAKASGFEHTAAAAEATIPKSPIDRRIATAGGDSARIATAESTANANRDSAARTRSAGAARAESTAGIATGGVRDATGNINRPKFTPEQTATRMQELKKAGNTQQQAYEIMKAEGYDVPPPPAPTAR